MLRSEVLPAPFGPITETSSSGPTSRSTPLTAWTPPNDLETPWMLSWALMERSARRRLAPPPRGGRGPRRRASGVVRVLATRQRRPPLRPPVGLAAAEPPPPTAPREPRL